MADNKVTLEIQVDAKDAEKAIAQFGAGAIKSINKVENATQSASDATLDIGAAFKTITGPVGKALAVITAGYAAISKGIEEAKQDQKVLLQINAALRSTGEFSEDAANGVVAYATALSDVTSVSDGVIKQSFITAKAFGVTNEQAQKLTKTALDYAAATGIDVESAVQRLGQTLDGSVGKVGNLGAEFRNLTEFQLKNGQAIDLVAKKYEGAAAAQSNTLEGATNRLTNSMGDLFKAFGRIATDSGATVKAINAIADAIGNAAGVFAGFNQRFKDETDAFNLKQAQKAVAVFDQVGNSSKAAGFSIGDMVKESQKFSSSGQAVDTFGQKLEQLAPLARETGKLTGKALEDAEKLAKDSAKEVSAFLNSINSSFGSNVEKEAARVGETLAKISEMESKIGSKEAADLRLKVIQDFNANRVKDDEEAYTKILALAVKNGEDVRKSAEEEPSVPAAC